MFRIAVCDDSETGSAELSGCIKELAKEISLETEVDVFRSFRSLYKAVRAEQYQLLILETSVAGVNGIEFARMIRQMGYAEEIVFCTSDAECALEAYSAYPVGYVLKPATKRKLRGVFRHVTERYQRQPAIVLKTKDGEKISVNISQIWYIEVFRTELDVHSAGEVRTCVGSLTDVFGQLGDVRFYRSHRSFIVNMEYVSKMDKYSFTMKNGDKVIIAKNRYAEAKAKFEEFVGNA